jgi:hypothetical protein
MYYRIFQNVAKTFQNVTKIKVAKCGKKIIRTFLHGKKEYRTFFVGIERLA